MIFDHLVGNRNPSARWFESELINIITPKLTDPLSIVERNTFENYSHGILFNARTRNENGGYAQNPAPVGGYSHLTDNIIRNNLFTNLYSTYSSGGGCCGGLGLNIYLEGDTNDPYVRNMYIYNNTFVTKSNVAPDTGLDFGNATATNADIQGLFIRNNIFQGFTGNWFRGGSGSKFSNVAITNNDAYNNGNSNAISWTGGTPANYTYTNNLTVDPKFISTTNYKL